MGVTFPEAFDASAVLLLQKPVLQIGHIGKGGNGSGSGESRRKGKLKACIIDPCRIFHQQESGGCCQRRRGIIGTPQQAGGQGKSEHDSGPHGRGGKSGHEEKGKQKESRNGTGGDFSGRDIPGRDFSGRRPAVFPGEGFSPGGLKPAEEGGEKIVYAGAENGDVQAADCHHMGNTGGLIQGFDFPVHSLFISQEHSLHHGGILWRKKGFQSLSHMSFQPPERLPVKGIIPAGAGNGSLPQFKGNPLSVIVFFGVEFARICGFTKMTDFPFTADSASDSGKIRAFGETADDLKCRTGICVLRSRTGFRCGVLKIDEPDGISGPGIRITDDIGYRTHIFGPLAVLPVRLGDGQRPQERDQPDRCYKEERCRGERSSHYCPPSVCVSVEVCVSTESPMRSRFLS